MIISRPARLTLLALAALIVAFVATWLTIPAGAYESKNLTTGRWETAQVAYPAKLLRFGSNPRRWSPTAEQPRRADRPAPTDLDARSRVLVAPARSSRRRAVGVAFGALRGY
jgi:hypothetical protein